MMKLEPDTIGKVIERMDAVKSRSKDGFFTNYFRQELPGGAIFSTGTERTIIFVIAEHDFFRLFFFTTDLADFGQVLAGVEFSGAVVAGYLSKSGEAPICEIFRKSGFENIAIYRRMTNLKLPRRPVSASIQYAGQSDVEMIRRGLFEIFNKYTDHLPTQERLLTYINNRQVLVDRREGEILGVLIFQMHGKQVNCNYLYNRSADGLALLMMQSNFYGLMNEKGVRSGFLWVNSTNFGVSRMQESLGWKFDGLQDHFYLKDFGG